MPRFARSCSLVANTNWEFAMLTITQGYRLADPLAASMFEDRKRLFVDTLGWDVSVTQERYEIDAFDGDQASYIVVAGPAGEHAGSLRLLPSKRPHILGALFPALCDFGVPVGDDIFEITRLCLPTRLGAAGRLAVRNRLISAMVDHALGSGIASLTAVVAWDFLETVLGMGWRCAPLGSPTIIGGARLGAFRIDLDGETVAGLSAAGIYSPGSIAVSLSEAA
jgi:N-acyl-L-homoserine lactone synthetase